MSCLRSNGNISFDQFSIQEFIMHQISKHVSKVDVGMFAQCSETTFYYKKLKVKNLSDCEY